MMTTANAAYVAGIIDGEGSVSLIKSFAHRTYGRYVYPLVRVANTDGRLIDWLSDPNNVPWRPSRTYKSAMNERCRDVHHLVWAVRQALGILEDVLPFLVIKREHAEIVLHIARQGKLAELQAGGKLGRVRHIPDWLLAERIAAVVRITELNKRGHHESVV